MSTRTEKKYVWRLGVNHCDFIHYVALFSTLEKAFEFLRSFDFEPEKCAKNRYQVEFTEEEAYTKGLFYMYYTKWNPPQGKYTMYLSKIELDTQLSKEYDE